MRCGGSLGIHRRVQRPASSRDRRARGEGDDGQLRDLSPHNVFVGANDGSRVLDFGTRAYLRGQFVDEFTRATR